uniref:Uncharacterized protein n=1 Tax=Manihot esculenta TaxID=3983 RepID=A0A2C9VYX3_MANES
MWLQARIKFHFSVCNGCYIDSSINKNKRPIKIID